MIRIVTVRLHVLHRRVKDKNQTLPTKNPGFSIIFTKWGGKVQAPMGDKKWVKNRVASSHLSGCNSHGTLTDEGGQVLSPPHLVGGTHGILGGKHRYGGTRIWGGDRLIRHPRWGGGKKIVTHLGGDRSLTVGVANPRYGCDLSVPPQNGCKTAWHHPSAEKMVANLISSVISVPPPPWGGE